MSDFVGRESYLASLDRELERVRTTARGAFVVVRGRRQVGKSRLVEVFCERSGLPFCFFQAARRTPARDLAAFGDELARSGLPASVTAGTGVTLGGWSAALSLAATGTSASSPAIVVIDEFPFLVDADPAVEGEFQVAWDRVLRRSPVLLVVVGSDLSVMESIAQYGRPLYGRPTREIHLPPLSPAEVAVITGLDAADALDAYLVVGGFPLVVRSWGRTESVGAFLRRALRDPTSAPLVVGERMLAAEFPSGLQARSVLEVVAHGETTFTGIARQSGLPHRSLQRSLELLAAKRVVDRVEPYSSRRSNLTRYSVSDPYLAFWIRFFEPAIAEAERGRGDVAASRILHEWPRYRGAAIEALVEESVRRLLPDERLGGAGYVGSFWTRTGDLQVDLVGGDRERQPRRVPFVGSVKWRERAPFDRRDTAALSAARPLVPGADDRTLLVGVSRSGFREPGLDATLEPDELLNAWN